MNHSDKPSAMSFMSVGVSGILSIQNPFKGPQLDGTGYLFNQNLINGGSEQIGYLFAFCFMKSTLSSGERQSRPSERFVAVRKTESECIWEI